jgi:hypothetical protein
LHTSPLGVPESHLYKPFLDYIWIPPPTLDQTHHFPLSRPYIIGLDAPFLRRVTLSKGLAFLFGLSYCHPLDPQNMNPEDMARPDNPYRSSATSGNPWNTANRRCGDFHSFGFQE